MPYGPLVNSQITDAVTQTNVKVLGEAPAEALAVTMQAMGHATGLAMENATRNPGRHAADQQHLDRRPDGSDHESGRHPMSNAMLHKADRQASC